MSSYTHLTRDERVSIACLLRADHSQKEIAEQLGRDPGTISRELSRNRAEKREIKYDVRKAQKDTQNRRLQANQRFRKIENNKALRNYIEAKLKKYWSPEQIAGRLSKNDKQKQKIETTVSHETIYQFIYNKKSDLKKYLRCQKGKYRRRYGTKKRERKREQEKKRRIDQRPQVINERKRIGDWEGDTIVGKRKNKHRILTHVERKSRYLLANKLKSGKAKATKKKAIQSLTKIPETKRLSITYDNGKEFSSYEMIERKTKATVYFAYPYHSWERGTNENTNGLLRQFFPKSKSFQKINQQDIDQVVSLLNNRPRKCLGYKTPQEVFSETIAL